MRERLVIRKQWALLFLPKMLPDLCHGTCTWWPVWFVVSHMCALPAHYVDFVHTHAIFAINVYRKSIITVSICTYVTERYLDIASRMKGIFPIIRYADGSSRMHWVHDGVILWIRRIPNSTSSFEITFLWAWIGWRTSNPIPGDLRCFSHAHKGSHE